MLMILGLIISIITRSMSAFSKRFFITCFSILLVYVGSILLEQFTLNPVASQVLIFIESLASSLLMPLFSLLILFFSGKNPLKSVAFYIAFSFFIVTVIVC